MPVACPSPRVTTARRGMAGGCWGHRSRTHAPLCASVPCSLHARGAGQAAQGVTVRHADRGCSCGHSTVSPAAGVAWCGDPGVSVASWPRLVGVPLAAAGVSRCWTPPTASLPPASASVPGVRSPEGVAGRSRRCGGGGGRELGARRWCPCRVRRRCPVRRRPAEVSHMRRERGALAARRCGEGTASLPCGGGGAPCRPSHTCASTLPVCAGGGTMRVPWDVSQAEAPRGQSGPGRSGVGGTAGPNKGVQATATSLRSCVAPALGGA